MNCDLTPQGCLQYGFTNAAWLDPTQLGYYEQVRTMCSANRCGRFDKSWSCPPACGTLDDLRTKALSFRRGILLQLTAKLDDAFDVETIQRSEKQCKSAFDNLMRALLAQHLPFLPMAVGSCTRCETCTYPDAPCRFPLMLAPSMEACGLLVSEVCERCGLPYYYGTETITWVCAVLFDRNEDE